MEYRFYFLRTAIKFALNRDKEIIPFFIRSFFFSPIQLQGVHDSSSPHWYKNRNVVRASMKARQMLTWILGKEDNKFKNCENLNML